MVQKHDGAATYSEVIPVGQEEGKFKKKKRKKNYDDDDEEKEEEEGRGGGRKRELDTTYSAASSGLYERRGPPVWMTSKLFFSSFQALSRSLYSFSSLNR